MQNVYISRQVITPRVQELIIEYTAAMLTNDTEEMAGVAMRLFARGIITGEEASLAQFNTVLNLIIL